MTRKLDHADAKALGLGDIEPYALFGAWVRGGQHMSGEAHGQWKPDREAIGQYARERGWAPALGQAPISDAAQG